MAIGGAAEEESFEVQAKVRISDPDEIIERLEHPEIEISRDVIIISMIHISYLKIQLKVYYVTVKMRFSTRKVIFKTYVAD